MQVFELEILKIELEILKIPMGKAYGLYSCPVRILKSACYILSKPLAEIINNSVETAIFPDRLKHAKIIPIFKSTGIDETDPSNKRPISLLSIFNRIFEKIMYNRFRKCFLEKNKLLYEK